MTGQHAALIAIIAGYVASDLIRPALAARIRSKPLRYIGHGFVAALVGYFALGVWTAWPVTFALGVIVAVAVWASDTTTRATSWLIVHLVGLISLAAIAWWLVPVTAASGVVPAEPYALTAAWSDAWFVMLLIALGGVITIEWGGTWVGRAIAPFAEQLAAPSQEETEDGIVTRRGLPTGFPDGGRMIGRLERLLIFLFVLANAPTAIGFLVTAKSILRFGEIKDRDSQKEAEYIIIGTLMSFGFALITSYLTRLVLLALLPEGTPGALSIGG